MFKILKFPRIADSTFKNCLGVLGYVMLERRNEFNYTFIPSKFIQPLSNTAKGDLIKYLINNKYIFKAEPFESKSDWAKKIEDQVNERRYKKKPNIYFLHSKLLNLDMIDLDDRRVEKVVVTSLHYLNFQSFNHWAHNYRRISLDVPNDKVWEAAIDDSYFLSKQNPNRDISFHTYNVIAWANNYGNPGFRSYDITATGLENHHFGGRVSNIFTNCNPILRNYTSFI